MRQKRFVVFENDGKFVIIDFASPIRDGDRISWPVVDEFKSGRIARGVAKEREEAACAG